jgi:hypothetical protein
VADGIALIIPLALPGLAPIFPWATISLSGVLRSRFRRREVAAILTMGMTAGFFAAQLARQWTPGMRKR